MQHNVKMMIENQEEIRDMEANANSIKEMSYEMKSKAKQLERETRKRNCRLIAVMVCLASAALLYFILAVFVN